jgi:hypothetical protein
MKSAQKRPMKSLKLISSELDPRRVLETLPLECGGTPFSRGYAISWRCLTSDPIERLTGKGRVESHRHGSIISPPTAG